MSPRWHRPPVHLGVDGRLQSAYPGATAIFLFVDGSVDESWSQIAAATRSRDKRKLQFGTGKGRKGVRDLPLVWCLFFSELFFRCRVTGARPVTSCRENYNSSNNSNSNSNSSNNNNNNNSNNSSSSSSSSSSGGGGGGGGGEITIFLRADEPVDQNVVGVPNDTKTDKLKT